MQQVTETKVEDRTQPGHLMLYSTSPTPNERHILQLARQRHPDQQEASLRLVVMQTPLEVVPQDALTPLWQHFGTQGVAVDLSDSGLATRRDASSPAVNDRLRSADLILITGGSPERAYRVLIGTPAADTLWRANQNGAVIAGDSAGALLLGTGVMTNDGNGLSPFSLLGWLPDCLVAPHFGAYDIMPWRRAFPECWVLGIPDGAMAVVNPARDTVESLGPEPLAVLPQGGSEFMNVPQGEFWKIG